MKGLAPLNVFISYAGPGRAVWEPLTRSLEQTYGCRIIWGMDEIRKYDSIQELMRQMVKKSDVALFLMTHHSSGVEEELQLWCEHHGNDFVNARLFKDPDVDLGALFEALRLKGVKPTPLPVYPLSATDPWKDIPYVLPAIHSLFCGTPRPGPEWKRQFNRIVHEANSRIPREKIPLALIRKVFEKICSLPSYESPDEWRFRLNWPRDAFGIDSYSKKVTCLDLLGAILHPNVPARGDEVEGIFTALEKVIHNRPQPPKKLSARILLEGASLETSREVKVILDPRAYERPPEEREEDLPQILRAEPDGLLLPKEVLLTGNNYECVLAAQEEILAVTSRICNYVLCSTFQISISRAMRLRCADAEEGLLAVACTAAGTDKERLSAIADIPLLVGWPDSAEGKVAWYGQRYREPTSEHRAHWRYHERSRQAGHEEKLIVHFHPVEMLELFYLIVQERIGESEVITEVEMAFKAVGLECVVYRDYVTHGARSDAFGNFLYEELSSRRGKIGGAAVVWKPNHGVWLAAANAEGAVGLLVKIENAAERAGERFRG